MMKSVYRHLSIWIQPIIPDIRGGARIDPGLVSGVNLQRYSAEISPVIRNGIHGFLVALEFIEIIINESAVVIFTTEIGPCEGIALFTQVLGVELFIEAPAQELLQAQLSTSDRALSALISNRFGTRVPTPDF